MLDLVHFEMVIFDIGQERHDILLARNFQGGAKSRCGRIPHIQIGAFDVLENNFLNTATKC